MTETSINRVIWSFSIGRYGVSITKHNAVEEAEIEAWLEEKFGD